MNDRQIKEVVEVRGLAAAIQAMASPTFKSLAELLHKLGWKLTRDETQTNKHESSN